MAEPGKWTRMFLDLKEEQRQIPEAVKDGIRDVLTAEFLTRGMRREVIDELRISTFAGHDDRPSIQITFASGQLPLTAYRTIESSAVDEYSKNHGSEIIASDVVQHDEIVSAIFNGSGRDKAAQEFRAMVSADRAQVQYQGSDYHNRNAVNVSAGNIDDLTLAVAGMLTNTEMKREFLRSMNKIQLLGA